MARPCCGSGSGSTHGPGNGSVPPAPVAMPVGDGALRREVDLAEFDQLLRSLPTAAPFLEPEPNHLAMLRPVVSSKPPPSMVMVPMPVPTPMATFATPSQLPRRTRTWPRSQLGEGPRETLPLLRTRSLLSSAGRCCADADADRRSLTQPLDMSPFLNRTSPGRFWSIFSQVLASQFIACFDGTIMASSHPVITSYFDAANSASWLSTAFLLTSTAFQPLLGRLSDAVGRKPLFLACLVVFAVATAGCGLANSIETFIVARALCGLGAGGSITLGSIITSDLIPIERRGPYQSYMNVTYGIGSALGGAMTESLGWRWEFGVQIPPLILCFVISTLAIPSGLGIVEEQQTSVWQALQAFDARGSLLLTSSICFLILGLNLGGNVLPWSHPLVIVCLLLFAIFFPTFLWVESRVHKPIMPSRFIRNPPRANIILSNFLAAVMSNSIFFNVPLYFQDVLLTSATSSGLRLVLPSLVSSAAGTCTGFLFTWTRRLKWPLLLGMILYLVGSVCLCLMRRNLTPAFYLLILVPSSLGQGFQFPGSFMAILACSAHSEQAVVTSTLILWRSLGMVLGVASSSLVVQNALIYCLGVYVQGPERSKVIARVRASVEAVGQFDEPYRDQVVRSYEAALKLTFACCIVLAAIGILLIGPLKLPRLAVRKP